MEYHSHKHTNTTITLLAILVLLSLFLSACGQPMPVYENYHTGKEGIAFSFTPNSPPKSVVANQQVPVVVTLHNKGAFDISNNYKASITLTYDTTYFRELNYETLGLQSLTQQRASMTLAGKSLYWPAGEQRYQTIGVLETNILGPRTKAQTDIIANICYPYGTELSTQVCVDADPYNLDMRTKVCTAEEQTFSAGQGGPIAITKLSFDSQPVGESIIEVDSQAPVYNESGNLIGTETTRTQEYVFILKPVVRLTIENVGKGELIRAREFGEQKLCTPQTNDYDLGTVNVRARLGNKWLTCTPSIVKLRGGSATTQCSLSANETLQVSSNYFDVLNVELAYVYRSSQTIKVDIEDTTRQLQDPLLFTATCASFDGQYSLCRQYSEMGSSLRGDGLNCYYCEITGKCLDTTCERCGTQTVLDSRTRRCVAPCNEQIPPSLGTTRVEGLSTVYVECSDPPGVQPLDHNNCGCARFHYSFISPDQDCQREVSSSMNALDAVWNSERRISTGVINIPPNYQPLNIPAGEESAMLCIAASTVEGTSTLVHQIPIRASR